MPTNAKNSFQELQNEETAKFSDDAQQKIRHKLDANVGFFHFLGEIVDLYLPKIFGLFVKMSGGGPSGDDNNPNRSSDNERPKYPNTID